MSLETRWVDEPEFREAIATALQKLKVQPRSVVGPGRSGAMAAVYASHILGVPFLPRPRADLTPTLVIDTIAQSGATIRKAVRKASAVGEAVGLTIFPQQPQRHRFWYEK